MIIRFILLLLIPFSLYSQRICDIGDYNYIFNTINGVEQYNFSKITLLDSINKQTFIAYKFDKFKRLKSAIFTNEGININLVESSPCYLRNNLRYTYSKGNILIRNIKQDTVKEFVDVKYYQNHSYNKIISDWIELNFIYNNDTIYKINRGYVTFKYYWKNGLISRINISFSRNQYPTRNILFFYDNNKLKRVEGLFANGKATYYYESDELIRIKFERMGKVIFHEFNYSNKEKLIITNTDRFGNYLSHYECVYAPTAHQAKPR